MIRTTSKRIQRSSLDVQAATVHWLVEYLLSVRITTAWRTWTLLPMYLAIFSSLVTMGKSVKASVGRSRVSSTSFTNRTTLWSLTSRICRLQARPKITFYTINNIRLLPTQRRQGDHSPFQIKFPDFSSGAGNMSSIRSFNSSQFFVVSHKLQQASHPIPLLQQ